MLLAALFCLEGCASDLSGQESAPVVEAADGFFVALESAKIRQGPSDASPALRQLEKGTRIQVTGRVVAGEWLQVVATDRQVGFVQEPLLQAVAETAEERRESAFWRRIEDSQRADDFEAYLKFYPQGRYAALAEAKRARLRGWENFGSPACRPGGWSGIIGSGGLGGIGGSCGSGSANKGKGGTGGSKTGSGQSGKNKPRPVPKPAPQPAAKPAPLPTPVKPPVRPPDAAPVVVTDPAPTDAGTTTSVQPAVIASGWAYLLAQAQEAAGYGLYSYLLFPVNDAASRPRYRAALRALRGQIDPVAAVTGAGFKSYEINITYLPMVEATPASADLDWLVEHHDFARAKRILATIGEEPSLGPYLVSHLAPLSAGPPKGRERLLVQDLAWVPEEVVALWLEQFSRDVKQPRYWDGEHLESFMLSARTAFSVVAKPFDIGAEAVNRFIGLRRALAGTPD